MAVENSLPKPSTGAPRSKRRRTAMAAPLPSWTLEMLAQHVRVHAYYLWEEEGRPAGNELGIWLRAEQQALTDMLCK